MEANLPAIGAAVAVLTVSEQASVSVSQQEKRQKRSQRQPEAESKISKNLILGCALAEATAIYGFIIGILIIILLG